MDCTGSIASLLASVHHLPSELIDVLRNAPNDIFLSRLAATTLNSEYTDKLFPPLESLFVELGARWLEISDVSKVVAGFGRIVPFAPYLAEYAEIYLQRARLAEDGDSNHNFLGHTGNEQETIELLLGLFRLLVFDNETFGKHLKTSRLPLGLTHSSRPIRYLTCRILSLYLHAADASMAKMIQRYLGGGAVSGCWEGKDIDYTFLSLWEEKRYEDMKDAISRARKAYECSIPVESHSRVLRQPDLSHCTAEVMGSILPRSSSSTPVQGNGNRLIPTHTTLHSVRNLCEGVLSSDPLLLVGPPGSGKTTILSYLAHTLGKIESMVTLHLNEQSDAKLLIGFYTSGSKPGTFTWKAGALTTAVREGRWVFIEDIDRAPDEIISTLLPLIERRELIIPGRGETVRAARGFKLIATMRTTRDVRGNDRLLKPHMLGLPFWRQLSISMLPHAELAEVMTALYPSLQAHVPRMLAVYVSLRDLFQNPKAVSQARSGSIRAITPRDLEKWCHRTDASLSRSTGFSDKLLDGMFLEAMDCFAGYLSNGSIVEEVAATVAQELHIDPSRKEYLLLRRDIRLESGGIGVFRIGRAQLRRQTLSLKHRARLRPFAINPHTLSLLEKIAIAVQHQEPLLLVGETGTGKTTCVQHLAEQLGQKLVPFNLSQQSESGDLLGGFKPVSIRTLVIPLKDEFDELFQQNFSQKRSAQFLDRLGECIAKGHWKKVVKLWKAALAEVKTQHQQPIKTHSTLQSEQQRPSKRQRTDDPHRLKTTSVNAEDETQRRRWGQFAAAVNDIEVLLSSNREAMAFTFAEGSIVKAVRNGYWILLDEINLATPDTLEALVDLLKSSPEAKPFVLLTESGNLERVEAHPDFRIFAAMNPATDIGKRDLPAGIRSRFTEIYVNSPDRDVKSLQSIVQSYLGELADARLTIEATNLYLKIQSLAESNSLVDGANQKPHFSLRTLTRALTYAKDMAAYCNIRHGLYEGFHMAFLTLLDRASENLLSPLIRKHIFAEHQNVQAELSKPLKKPCDGYNYIKEGKFWLRQGAFPTEDQPHYIITPFVRRNLDNLIRATFTRKYPILLQGPTSSGKTSMIEYLARRSGNKFVRINNHEHTDLQEYLGSYISTTDGSLRFQEGLLVEALRNGYWIVLDELNLAPTDVLEALNRLLDDNRELLIPETQEVVRPHPDFMLFATQNPAGLYGGRKHLSRAFRNRFLEMHFDDIPVEELADILHQRTQIPESWSRRIVDVYKELSALRQANRIFEQKSFATLRDLFRWALRKADSVEELAINGFMLLAERVRNADERAKLKEVIENVMSRRGPRVRIDEQMLYSETASPEIALYKERHSSEEVVWTKSMRRLFVLVSYALRNNEPVLLVGDTGCGKTTVCQMLAEALGKELYVLNAHQNTETGDIIGSQRPIRNRALTERLLREHLSAAFEAAGNSATAFVDELVILLQHYDQLIKDGLKIPEQLASTIQKHRGRMNALFEWQDGSLVQAMKLGQIFLLDEISLADDSVLERLNSVLEPSRSLLLAEKGPIDSLVVASDSFQFLATMNPGGDYGKKELSPALRNRFTEIWVPSIHDTEDVLQIVRAKLRPDASQFSGAIVEFSRWFNDTFNTSAASSISIRDTLAWVEFVNHMSALDPIFAIGQGAAMVFIDTLGANPAALLSISSSAIETERQKCIAKLGELIGTDVSAIFSVDLEMQTGPTHVSIGSFAISRAGPAIPEGAFSFHAQTTRRNLMRLFRGLQLRKPILIEGNPGVGKTTLVTAMAKVLGRHLIRINLSEQTDLMDLFGSDIPVEGANVGTFSWRDAPFLTAMKQGDWVLLDEMNLASQSVLEGLNACLDHRGEAYIAELNQTFHRHPEFRIFAAQNPHHQGGGRKGLPASFVNRFTVVYADVFRPDDLHQICKQVFPSASEEIVAPLIRFVDQLETEVVHHRKFGSQGGPWEFNLRDTLRWLQLSSSSNGLLPAGRPYDFCDIIFRQRFRNERDRAAVDALYSRTFNSSTGDRTMYHNLAHEAYQVGLGVLPRSPITSGTQARKVNIPVSHLPTLEGMMLCVQQNWPVILVGPPGSGKSSLIEHLTAICGKSLLTFSLNSDIDAMDLVGGFEQVDPSRNLIIFLRQLRKFAADFLLQFLVSTEPFDAQPSLIRQLLQIVHQSSTSATNSIELENIVKTLEEATMRGIPQASELLHEASLFSSKNSGMEQAQFEWVDGLLVQALQHGDWLVLDNANLCSSSVLDRLNSLLEPDGYLSINEHPTENGEARILKPHPNFRIFLTMDPRNGELSRAMRNRAIELFVPQANIEKKSDSAASFSLEAAIYRFRNVRTQFKISSASARAIADVTADHLSFSDVRLVEQFLTQIRAGLLGTEISAPTSIYEKSLSLVSSTPDAWTVKAQQVMVSIALFSDEQPIHPLNNELVSRAGHPCTQKVFDLASWYEVIYQLLKMDQSFESAISQASTEQSSTALVRSIVAARQSQGAKHSITKLARFLLMFKDSMKEAIQMILDLQDVNKETFSYIDTATNFWWALYHFSEAADFQESILQAVVALGRKRLEAKGQSASLAQLLERHKALMLKLDPPRQSSTGFAIEQLWHRYRPPTVTSMNRLDTLLHLEALTDRFDELLFKTITPLDQLCRTREAFRKAIATVFTSDVDIKPLLLELETILNGIQTQVNAMHSAPFFQQQFGSLNRIIELHGLSIKSWADQRILHLQRLSSLLAGHPTKVESSLEVLPHDHSAKSSLLRLCGNTSKSHSELLLPDATLSSVEEQISKVDEVMLSNLGLVQEELDVLGKLLSLGAPIMCADIVENLSNTLQVLWEDFKSATQFDWTPLEKHDDFRGLIDTIESFMSNVTHDRTYENDEDRRDQLDNDSRKISNASNAWMSFGILAILLYVPNRLVDPAINQEVERKVWTWDKERLEERFKALIRFEHVFSGQSTNVRSRQIITKIEALGPQPHVAAVARPQIPQLSALQNEFINVLRLARNIDPSKHGKTSQDPAVRRNLEQLITRLRSNYRAYDDLTLPLAGFLQCLVVGLDLSQSRHFKPCRDDKGSFLGDLKFIRTVCGRDSKLTSEVLEQPGLHELMLFGIARTVDPTLTACHGFRSTVDWAFACAHKRWRDMVATEQERNAKQSSLYTFRGAREDEDDANDEEFKLLFPTFEADERENMGKEISQSPKDACLCIYDLHAAIFSDQYTPTELILKMVGHNYNQDIFVREESAKENPSNGSAIQLLPKLMLIIHERSTSTSPQPGDVNLYNFYKDPNIAEATRLVALINRVGRHFSNLREAWPEHDTIAEIIRFCEETLSFRHTDPVAKFLTKLEKLHEVVHEWQKVTSKEYSAASLYDEITTLIISWRRLELGTWVKLFDIELEKCLADAKSWWFLAYETIIAASRSYYFDKDERPVESYAVEMFRTLQSFIAESPVGQFQQRLNLLNQLSRHLQLIVKDVSEESSDAHSEKGPEVIYDTLENLIGFYGRYQQPVSQYLQNGRQLLERDVKEVVQLASWKDTTIEALKQSAKTSHRKLFKLVRKYRVLLQTPVTSIIEHGIPENSIHDIGESDGTVHTNLSLDSDKREYYRTATGICEHGFKNWATVPSEFKDVPGTLASIPAGIPALKLLNGPQYISDFITYLSESMSRLQKETPQTLTEDNKSLVKHLKFQKRKLFADTLREMRKMGIQYNLSENVLSGQGSLSAIMANIPASLKDSQSMALRSAEFYFHKSLDLMPQVRQMFREHSNDLTPAEITRSVGYLEGLLHLQIKQTTLLRNCWKYFGSFQNTLGTLQTLWDQSHHGLMQQTSQSELAFGKARERAVWLVPVLRVFKRVIQVQAELGEFNVSTVIEGIDSWTNEMNDLVESFDEKPKLPTFIACDFHSDIQDRCRRADVELKRHINSWSQDIPVLSPVLSQLRIWLEEAEEVDFALVEKDSPANTHGDLNLFQKNVFRTWEYSLRLIHQTSEKLSTLPTSTDEPSWLTKLDDALAVVIKALLTQGFTGSFESSFQQLRGLSSEELRPAAALIGLALPILRRYESFVKDALEQYSSLCSATCRLSYRLAKAFVHIGKEGFCIPPETDNEGGRQGEKLEDGTGLGDGEGANDISKDIGKDEDLTELAEDVKNNDRQQDVEDEPDAVDMADADLEGEMGDVSDRGEEVAEDNASEDEEKEVEEQVGEVDDLGPGAADEKVLNEGDMAEKDKDGSQGKGSTQGDQIAGKSKSQQDEPEVDEADAGAEEFEEVTGEPTEKTDQYLPEGETLDLPENMDLESNSQQHSDSSSLDGMEDFNDHEAINSDYDGEDVAADEDIPGEAMSEDIVSEAGDEEIQSHEDNDRTAGQQEEPDDIQRDEDMEYLDRLLDSKAESANTAEDALTSEVRGGPTATEPQEDRGMEDAMAMPAENDQGSTSRSKDSATEAMGESGTNGEGKQGGRDDELQDAEVQAFKKLGNTLETWYNQQRQIRQAQEGPGDERMENPQDTNFKDTDFEHLPDDDARADTQALGMATQDQAIALDERNAVHPNDEKTAKDELVNGNQEEVAEGEDVEMPDVESNIAADQQRDIEGTLKAFIGDSKSLTSHDLGQNSQDPGSESDLEEVDTKLSTVNLSPSSDEAKAPAVARALWSKHEASTRPLAAMLTEQLRLILAPTLATKLRGDFRTGKRLNIRRIIPYIASSYKRDKIWMRRSVPSKRSYQLMIALDDSKSMSEGGSKDLAFETLALISKALAMLEAGQLCVVGFGANVKVHHPFDRPFTDDAGVDVFSGFEFNQQKTDIRTMVIHGIHLFQEARERASGSAAELWQLMLIISDGICEDHEGIKRLVRRAQEERIMIVFVVIDAGAAAPKTGDKKAQSIMELQTAEFIKDESGLATLVRKRYMDSFPFRWWLVVQDISELPGVLAMALRQWFAEVVDASG